MKKKFNIFIILLLLFAFITVPITKADTGWDGDYDYGGGGWDSDYDYGGWDNDYDYGGGGRTHYGSSSGGSSFDIVIGGVNVTAIVAFIVAIIVIIVIVKNNLRPMIPKQKPLLHDGNPRKILTEEEIKNILPNFNMNEFKETVFKIYQELQVAWMNFDYDTIRKYTTDELYNLYHSQLIALNVKKQKNIMKDFALHNFTVVETEHNDKSVALTVCATIECYDYVVDANNNVLRGNSSKKVTYNYRMTFVKGLSDKANKCPNCNAPLENNRSSVCPYCGSTIISDNYDWVLSKKEVLSQTSNRKL